MSTWPSGTDLRARLAAAGVTMPDGSAVPTSIASDALVLAAVRLFEERTGWIPFEANSQTRLFDPPNWGSLILKLNGGLISVVELMIDNVVKTEGTDFWLQRSRPDMPAWGIRFLRPIAASLPQKVSVEGDWGRMEEADELAVEAVLNLACEMASQMIIAGYMALPVESREADVAEKFSVDGLRALGAGFMAMAEPVIALYRRVTVGL